MLRAGCGGHARGTAKGASARGASLGQAGAKRAHARRAHARRAHARRAHARRAHARGALGVVVGSRDRRSLIDGVFDIGEHIIVVMRKRRESADELIVIEEHIVIIFGLSTDRGVCRGFTFVLQLPVIGDAWLFLLYAVSNS
jgi:hypothetical protein